MIHGISVAIQRLGVGGDRNSVEVCTGARASARMGRQKVSKQGRFRGSLIDV